MQATADRLGGWRTTLRAEPAGGPFSLSVAAGQEHLERHDVLVGDVWLASGQSNMEFRLATRDDAAREIAGAHDIRLREFKIPNSWSLAARDRSRRWQLGARGLDACRRVQRRRVLLRARAAQIDRRADRHHQQHVGRQQHRNVDQPVGPSGSPTARGPASCARNATPTTRCATACARSSAISRQTDHGLVDGRALWAAPGLDDSGWATMPVPSYWEANGYEGMDGVAWYRVTFEVPPSAMHGDATLTMAAIDDDDMAWINGVEVGQTKGYNVARSYRVPNSALREGTNVLAVRVVDGGGGGGINGDVSISFADGGRETLNGPWKFKVAVVSFEPDGQRINKIPTVLYNE